MLKFLGLLTLFALPIVAGAVTSPTMLAVRCTNSATTTYVNGAPSNTISSEVSPTATGATAAGVNATVCAVPATEPNTWYLRVSNDGGVTYTFVTLASLGFGSAGNVPPPPNANAAVLTWTAPTQNTDGTTITAPLTYNVYRGASATALTKLTSVSALTYTDPAGSATPTTYFYAITAVEAGVESVDSGVVSKTIAAAALTPGAPTSLVAH
jgi:hypothetical protein